MDNARYMPQMKLRLPPELKIAIEDSAQQNFRSLNNEVVKRLLDSFATKNAPAAVTAGAPN